MTNSNAKAMGALYDLLLNYVDTAQVHDSNYEIACALVEQYTLLPRLSLRDMAELCFVSPASFSRFCRFLGFESFAEFKEAVNGANYRLSDDYSRVFLAKLDQGENQALVAYRSMLTELIDSTLNEEDIAIVPELLDVLEGANRIVFFSHHFPWHIGRYFQSKMLQMGRCVELYQSYGHQMEAAESLGEGDVAIICSINGTYFSHYAEIVREIFASGAKVAVITQNRRAMFINRADYVLSCGNTNENDLGKYAALMTIDYLVMCYLRRVERGLREDPTPS